MTNLEKFKAMSLGELTEWLDEQGQFDDAPWTHWFDSRYCQNCEPIKLNYEDAKEKLGIELFSWDLTTGCAFCECNDHCKFFPNIKGIPSNKEIIEMWLIEEAENEKL